MLGYSHQEISTISVTDIHPKESLPFVLEQFEKISREEIVLSTDIPVLRKNKSIFYADISASPFKLNGKNYLVGILRDITEKQQQEQMLIKEKEVAQQFLNLVGSMVIALDKDGKLTLVNRKSCQVLGWTEEQVIGKDWFNYFISKDIRDKVKKVFQQLMSGDVEPVEFHENKILTKEGSERVIAWHNTILKDNENQIIGILSAGEDITESKRIHQELIKSEEHFRQLFEGNKIVELIINPVTGHILEANRAAEKFYGYSRKQLVDLNISDINTLTSNEINEEMALAKTEKREHFQFKHKLANGDIRDVEVHSGPIYWNQQKVLYSIIHDISDRKRIENALIKSEERFSLAMRGANDGLWDWNLKNNEIVFSERWKSMLGYTQLELEDKFETWEKLVHPEDLKDAKQCIEDYLDRKISTYKVEFRMRHKEKYWVDILARGFALRNKLTNDPIRFIGTHVDITERKQAEVKLIESHRILSTLMNNLPGMSYRCKNNKQWTMEFASEGCHTLTGYSAADLINNQIISYAELIHPEDQRRIWGEIQEGLNRNNSFEVEYRLMTASGEEKWIWERGVAVKGTGSLEGVIFDNDAHKRAESALRESENEYKELINELSDLLYRTDNNGVIVFASPSFETLTGYQLDEAIGKIRIEELYERPQDREALIIKIREEGLVENYEVKLKRKDGTAWWGSVNSHSYRNNTGQILGVEGLVRDITEPKQIREDMQKLARAVEQSPDSILITNTNAEIEYVNKAFIRTTGYSQNDVMGLNPSILQSGKTPNNTYVEMWNALNRGENWQGELINQRKDGSEYTEWAHISPMSQSSQANGEVSNYVAVQEDITEKKRLAKELDSYRHQLEHLVDERTSQLVNAQQQAEKANQAKSDFLANMSHEIRTTMNGVIGMTHLALQTELSDKQHNYISKAYKSAEHLLGILNDILDFSKIEAGKIEIETIDFRLEDVLEHVKNILSFKCEEKGIESSYSIDQSVPMGLIGDPLRLGQILLNIGNNAVKFTPEGGSITACVEVKDKDGDNITLHFWMRDTGIGMTKEQMGRLFQPFSQADASTTRQYGGSGLGLIISKNFAEMMGGTIWVDSTPDLGSTFHITVCLKKQQGHFSQRQAINTNNTVNLKEIINLDEERKILLVEDNQINQEIVLEYLADETILVEAVKNGKEALEKLEKESFDLVLMDCQMPVMDGFEATRRIRAQEKFKNLPIIALTANAMKNDIEKCLQVGMNAHIAKPINPDVLFKTIANWIKATTSNSVTTATTALNEVLSKKDFSELDGISFSKSTLKSTKMFKKYLLKFLQRFSGFEQEFKEAQNGDDETEPGRLAHSLKGLAGTLGMIELQQQANLLEKANINKLEGIDDLLVSTTTELNIIIQSIKKHEPLLHD